MKLYLKTHSGKIVYKRKKHFFTERDAQRIVENVYEAYINTGLYVRSNQERANQAYRWKYIASLAFQGFKALLQSLEEYPGDTLSEIAQRTQITAEQIEVIRFASTLSQIIFFLDKYAGWVPYVGDVAAFGKALIEILVNVIGVLPPYHINEKGEIILD